MGKRAAFACTLALVGLTTATGARAAIQFCNKFPQKIFVAIAYSQADGSWESRGWLELDNGDCRDFDSALHPGTLFYRGESVTYRNQRGQNVTTVWSTPGHQFATWEKDNFEYWGAEGKVLNSTLEDFTLVADDLDNDTSVTVTFEEDGIHTTTDIKRPPR
ncbi:MAG: DUF1036 domain-containing protein [Bradyrhizobium sp.]|nr:MAG: DUF1036 domain-containing protein [Bradyrhizobium sp.]